MRKQTKLVAVLSAAALVALGASMTSMAAGWVQQDGLWYYENANGDYATDEWKRSGDNYFYLGWDGYMLTNQLVQHGDNYYYVDANGAMVKNQWVAVATDGNDSVDHRWYRFGSTGRAYRGSNGFRKVTIDGKKYAFDEEGKMLYGWVDDGGTELNDDTNAPISATYFFGPNDTTAINGVTYTGGAMVTGWYNYLDGIDIYDNEGDDSLWFYFNTSTGEKVADTTRRIGGLYYSFDENGKMNSGWQEVVASSSTGTSSSFINYSGSDQGWRQRNTWIWTVPSAEQNQDDHDNEVSRWFRVGGDGKVVTGAKRINSKWYVFDEAGIMKAGLVTLNADRIATGVDLVANSVDVKDNNADDGVLEAEYYDAADIYALEGANLYFFSADEENDGSMKTGSNVQIELADGTYTFGFDSHGLAYDGVQTKTKKLYNNGILQTGGDMRYAAKEDPTHPRVWYVVGPTGTFASNNSTVRDADDNYYAVTDAKIYYVPAGDYASRIARAIVTLGKGQVSSLYVPNDGSDPDNDADYIKATADNVKAAAEVYIRVDSETYEPVKAEWVRGTSGTSKNDDFTNTIVD